MRYIHHEISRNFLISLFLFYCHLSFALLYFPLPLLYKKVRNLIANRDREIEGLKEKLRVAEKGKREAEAVLIRLNQGLQGASR